MGLTKLAENHCIRHRFKPISGLLTDALAKRFVEYNETPTDPTREANIVIAVYQQGNNANDGNNNANDNANEVADDPDYVEDQVSDDEEEVEEVPPPPPPAPPACTLAAEAALVRQRNQ